MLKIVFTVGTIYGVYIAPKILSEDIDSYLQLIYKVNFVHDLLVYGSNYEFATDDPKNIEDNINVNKMLC